VDCLDLKIEIKLPSLNLFRKNMLTTMVYFFLSMKRMQGGFEHSLERFFFFVTLIIYLVYLFIGKGIYPQTFLDAPKMWGIIWQVVKRTPNHQG